MPFYKDSLPGSKNRWREQLRQAMKRRALRTTVIGAITSTEGSNPFLSTMTFL